MKVALSNIYWTLTHYYAHAFILAENMEKGNLMNQYEINTKRELKYSDNKELFDFIPDRKNKTDSSIIIASRFTIIRIITPRKYNYLVDSFKGSLVLANLLIIGIKV